MGLLQWVQGKTSSMTAWVQSAYSNTISAWVVEPVSNFATAKYNGAVTTYRNTLETYRRVTAFMRQEGVRTYISDTLLQFGEGLTRTLNPAPLLSLFTGSRPKTAWAMLVAQFVTAVRLGQVLGYYWVKPAIRRTIAATVYENYYLEEAGVFTVDILAHWYFTRNLLAAMLADNVALGNALSKTSTLESTESKPGTHELMRACKHCENGGTANFGANIASLLNYYLNWVVLSLLDRAIPGLRYVMIPHALFNGRTYLEYPLAAAGNCTKHRLKVLTENNSFAAGFGVTSVAWFFALKEVIARYTGVRDSFFVDEALSASLAFYFIVHMNLTRKLRLPGDTPGIDYFEPTRLLVDKASKSLQQRFTAAYSGKGDVNWYEMLKAGFSEKMNSTPALVLRWVLLQNNLQDYYGIMQRQSMRLYMEHSREDIIKVLEGVIAMRTDWFYKVLNKAKFFMPFMDDNQRRDLGLVMDKYLKSPMYGWLRFFYNPYNTPSLQVLPAKTGTYARIMEYTPIQIPRPIASPDRVEILPDEDEVKNANVAKPTVVRVPPAPLIRSDVSYASLLNQPIRRRK